MTGLGLEKNLAARAVVRRVAVVFLVLQVVPPVGLVFELVLTVGAGRIGAQALRFFRLFSGVRLGQPDAGPDRVLDVAALELGPDGSPFLGDEKHADVFVASVGKAGPRPFRPVLLAGAEHRRDFESAAAEPLRIVVVPQERPVFAIPAVLVAFLVLPVLCLDHCPSSGSLQRKETAQHLAYDAGDGSVRRLLRVGLGHGMT